MADLPLTASVTTAVDLAMASTGVPVGTALDLVRGFIDVFQERVTQRRAARAMQVYLDQWATLRGLDAGDAEDEVRRMLHDGTAEEDEALHQMFRSMAFSRSPAAWPYIARMTAEYVNDGRPVDEFFRRLGVFLERAAQPDIKWCRRFSQITGLADGGSNEVAWHIGVKRPRTFLARASFAGGGKSCIAAFANGAGRTSEVASEEVFEPHELFVLLSDSRILSEVEGRDRVSKAMSGPPFHKVEDYDFGTEFSGRLTFNPRRVVGLFFDSR